MTAKATYKHPRHGSARIGLTVELAATAQEVEEAQRLRQLVLSRHKGDVTRDALDLDHYDPHCHHLVVRDYHKGTVVGVTRIMTDRQAKKAGGYYADSRFDLSRLLPLPGRTMEVGATCIHPDYENSGVYTILWAGLARFITIHRMDFMIGCIDIPLMGGVQHAKAIISHLCSKHAVPSQLNVMPRQPLLITPDASSEEAVQLPPLLDAYLRLGAYVWERPGFNEEHNMAELFVLLDTDNLSPRYQSEYLERGFNTAVEEGGAGPVYL
ncbi:GNAT family N-acetyltransferase [Pseudomonadota bacterium]